MLHTPNPQANEGLRRALDKAREIEAGLHDTIAFERAKSEVRSPPLSHQAPPHTDLPANFV